MWRGLPWLLLPLPLREFRWAVGSPGALAVSLDASSFLLLILSLILGFFLLSTSVRMETEFLFFFFFPNRKKSGCVLEIT